MSSSKRSILLYFLAGAFAHHIFFTHVGVGFLSTTTLSVVQTAPKEESSSSSVSTMTGNPSKKTILHQTNRSEIFHMSKPDIGNSFVGPAGVVIDRLVRRFDWLDTITVEGQNKLSSLERARSAYIEMIKCMVSGTVYLGSELSIKPALGVPRVQVLGPLDTTLRQKGDDWTYLGDTMTGWARIDNVHKLLKDVFDHNIPGDYIETGVWRGGSSMFARAVMHAYGQAHRKSYVCDSFAGLPPSARNLDNLDKGWDGTPYLEVHQDIVVDGFEKYSMLDENVFFVKGFFNDTMPHVRPLVDSFSVMRLDGDMYESTVDVLYHLYDKLSVGGYVIMDDWDGFPSKTACLDFFSTHGISPQVIKIDTLSAYWQKTEQVELQYWRYEQNKFK